MTLAKPVCAFTSDAPAIGEYRGQAQSGSSPRGQRRPRLALYGAGRLGRACMQAMVKEVAAEEIAVPNAGGRRPKSWCADEPNAPLSRFHSLLELPLDGIVLATPGQSRAKEAEVALERGIAVFSLSPLAGNVSETRRVIDAAKQADRLLGVDLPFRCSPAAQRMRDCVAAGHVGKVFAVDLVFHTARGRAQRSLRNALHSAGGCVVDLGLPMIHLALWVLNFPEVHSVSSCLHAEGRQLALLRERAEDYAVVHLGLANGCVVRLACSWSRLCGRGATIEARFHGTLGASLALRSTSGSPRGFVVECFDGTRTQQLATALVDRGTTAAVHWAQMIAAGARFDAEIQQLEQVAGIMDAIYAR